MRRTVFAMAVPGPQDRVCEGGRLRCFKNKESCNTSVSALLTFHHSTGNFPLHRNLGMKIPIPVAGPADHLARPRWHTAHRMSQSHVGSTSPARRVLCKTRHTLPATCPAGHVPCRPVPMICRFLCNHQLPCSSLNVSTLNGHRLRPPLSSSHSLHPTLPKLSSFLLPLPLPPLHARGALQPSLFAYAFISPTCLATTHLHPPISRSPPPLVPSPLFPPSPLPPSCL